MPTCREDVKGGICICLKIEMSKIFTVFGATGQQGGALIKYLLNHPRFLKIYRVRGVTRDVGKSSARALVDLGVEMVEADMNDPISLEKATRDSHTVFAMTNYWDTASRAAETAQGKALADAAVAASATLLIWSSLPRIGLPNFDSKADVEDYIRTLPITSAFFMPGWFMQNQLTFARPQQQEDGKYVLKRLFPGCESTTLVPLVDIEDIGRFLQPVLDEPERYTGMRLTGCRAFVTPVEMCRAWERVAGVEVIFEGDNNGDGEDVGVKGEKDTWGGGGKEDSPYYGPGSKEALEWTLAQMEEEPGSWEGFVERCGPWFE
ncbi:NAD(P)-binding protein [Lentithecium fluviatile CBS 122367]|uniref:NAD(P)-binding protein n=1 Tax=Lentithecium fluviatile CBS 122367 TaxID=1168545 RepID=A0A6G1JGL0_9PLEO|nr:NAD(P)-binding protein [Lentithecium fluviatile CBS 122367]